MNSDRGEPPNEGLLGADWSAVSGAYLIDYLLRSDHYVVGLDAGFGIERANAAFERTILAPQNKRPGSFLETLADESKAEVHRLAERGELNGREVELRHFVRERTTTVQYTFRAVTDGWIAIGRDQSAQLELVQQMSLLVRELEEKIHQERALSEDLRNLAEQDALTQLPNRRHFEKVYQDNQRRFTKDGRCFSILCVDLDLYKDVNDKFGHPVGDEVLREVAAVLGASTREKDVAARFGGDEFVLVAPGVDGTESLEMAERLRSAVERATMPEPVGKITVSVGVASTKAGEPERAKRLLELADSALYRAKAQGRNQVHAAE